MNQKIKREFLAQALRAYLEPTEESYLTPLDAANLSIEFLHGMGLLQDYKIDFNQPAEGDPGMSA